MSMLLPQVPRVQEPQIPLNLWTLEFHRPLLLSKSLEAAVNPALLGAHHL